MKQVVNCNSDKAPIRFPLFLLLAMLKTFDTTVSGFPGRLISGIAKPFKLILYVIFSFSLFFSRFFFRQQKLIDYQ